MQAIEQKAIPGVHLPLEVMRAAALKQRHDMTLLLAGESGKPGWGFTSLNSNQDLLI